MTGSVHLNFYATLFRGDRLGEALHEIAAKSLHYGATAWTVYRYQDDRYKFLVAFDFESKQDWNRFWNSEDFIDFRIRNQTYYQVPLVYSWTEKVGDAATAPAI